MRTSRIEMAARIREIVPAWRELSTVLWYFSDWIDRMPETIEPRPFSMMKYKSYYTSFTVAFKSMESFQSNEILGTIVFTGIPPATPLLYDDIFMILEENRLIAVCID